MVKQKIKENLKILIIMLILLLTCVFYLPINRNFKNLLTNRFKIISIKNNLLVHFISVGQGDAMAINLPNGKVMLIDTGSKNTNISYTTYLQDKVINNSHTKNIDYLILTHADIDHVGGTLRLLKNFKIGTIYMPTVNNTAEYFTELKAYVEINFIPSYLTEDLVFNEAGCEINIFEPISLESTNSSCPLVKVGYKGKSFLFTGDISQTEEQLYLEKYGDKLNCDVLKVSHHGSKYSTSTEFLDVVSPNYAVISVGVNNYGHPTQETCDRIANVNATLLRTDQSGSIMFVQGDGYDLKVLNNFYIISNLHLDYRILVLVLEGIIIIQIGIKHVKQRIKKSKKKHSGKIA